MTQEKQAPVGRLEKKKEHYLPRRFLERFTKNGRFTVALQRKDGSFKLLSNQKPDNHGYATYLYETSASADVGKGEYLFPNEIENALQKVEVKLFGDLERCESKLRSDPGSLSEDDVDSICCTVSFLISHLMARAPSSIANSRQEKGRWLNAMKECGLSTHQELAELYRDATGEPLGERYCLEPGQVAEHASVDFNLNLSGVEQELLPYSDTGFFFRDIVGRDFEFLFTIEEHPFVGISLPRLMGAESDGITPKEVYFPLSSTLAVICSRGRGKRLSTRVLQAGEVRFFNTISASMIGWDMAFCENDATMRGLSWGNRDIVK